MFELSYELIFNYYPKLIWVYDFEFINIGFESVL
jgi:hypothetical protein